MLQEARITLFPSIHAEAILFPKKCQSQNNHNIIVLSLFTEQSLIALHRNSIFKVHCARKIYCSYLIHTFSSKPGRGWEVCELCENPHFSSIAGRALSQHPIPALFLFPHLPPSWPALILTANIKRAAAAAAATMTKRAAWGHRAPALLSEQKQSSLGAVGSVWSSHLVRASANNTGRGGSWLLQAAPTDLPGSGF